LYLTRKIGESIVINDNIELTVVDIRGRSAKLGLTFPADVTIYRREVFDRIQTEKTQASQIRSETDNVTTAGNSNES